MIRVLIFMFKKRRQYLWYIIMYFTIFTSLPRSWDKAPTVYHVYCIYYHRRNSLPKSLHCKCVYVLPWCYMKYSPILKTSKLKSSRNRNMVKGFIYIYDCTNKVKDILRHRQTYKKVIDNYDNPNKILLFLTSIANNMSLKRYFIHTHTYIYIFFYYCRNSYELDNNFAETS